MSSATSNCFKLFGETLVRQYDAYCCEVPPRLFSKYDFQKFATLKSFDVSVSFTEISTPDTETAEGGYCCYLKLPEKTEVKMVFSCSTDFSLGIAMGDQGLITLGGTNTNYVDPNYMTINNFVAGQNIYLSLPHTGPYTAVTLLNSTTATPLVLGVDYLITNSGITILGTSTLISNGDLLDITYTYPKQINHSLFKSPSTDIELKFKGKNLNQNLGNNNYGNMEIWIPRLTLSPASNFSFIGGDFMEFEVTGSLLQDICRPNLEKIYINRTL